MRIPLKSNFYADLKVLGGLVALSVLMRFFSFFPTIISHDEGTFLVIAREIFMGKIYFADIIDTKPIGIFLILGLFIKFISSSIFMIRLFAAVIVAITAFTIYKISLYDQGERKPAIIAGAVFIFLLSIFTHFGVFINAEIFYILFTAIAFYIFIRSRKLIAYLFLGVLAGIGFIIKYVVLFDLTAWLLYALVAVLMLKDWKAIRNVFFKCVAATMGFFIPFVILVYYYYQVGHLKDFWFYTFGVTSRIPVERTFIGTLIYIGDFHLRFLPVVFFFYYVLINPGKKKLKPHIPNGLIITWCFMVLLAIIIPGKPFGHYFIQLMLPVSLVAGRFFCNDLAKPLWISKIIRHPVGTILVAVIITVNVVLQKHDFFDKPDLTKQVAEYLSPRLKPEDRIFTGNFQAVLYYLLEKECPVKYVHRSLICDPRHRESLKIDLNAEMDSLMNKEFTYITMKNEYCYEPVNVYLEQYYDVIAEFQENICIYRRK